MIIREDEVTVNTVLKSVKELDSIIIKTLSAYQEVCIDENTDIIITRLNSAYNEFKAQSEEIYSMYYIESFKHSLNAVQKILDVAIYLEMTDIECIKTIIHTLLDFLQERLSRALENRNFKKAFMLDYTTRVVHKLVNDVYANNNLFDELKLALIKCVNELSYVMNEVIYNLEEFEEEKY